jgi:hypothetical protein
VVITRRCQRLNPGSSPGRRILIFFETIVKKFEGYYKIQGIFLKKKETIFHFFFAAFFAAGFLAAVFFAAGFFAAITNPPPATFRYLTH